MDNRTFAFTAFAVFLFVLFMLRSRYEYFTDMFDETITYDEYYDYKIWGILTVLALFITAPLVGGFYYYQTTKKCVKFLDEPFE